MRKGANYSCKKLEAFPSSVCGVHVFSCWLAAAQPCFHFTYIFSVLELEAISSIKLSFVLTYYEVNVTFA